MPEFAGETTTAVQGLPRDVVQRAGTPKTQRVQTVLFPGTPGETVVEETLVFADPGGKERPFPYYGTTGLSTQEADAIRCKARGIPYRSVAQRFAAYHEKELKRMRDAVAGSAAPAVPGVVPSSVVSEAQAMLASCDTPEMRRIVQLAWARKMGVSEAEIGVLLKTAEAAPVVETQEVTFSDANLRLRRMFGEYRHGGLTEDEFTSAKLGLLLRVQFADYEDQEVVGTVASIMVEAGVLSEEEARTLVQRAPEPVTAG